MARHETTIRVRYSETDAMGIVHHSGYAVYYEQARIEMLRSLGVSYRDMERDGIMMPVVGLYIRFHAPARYDDLLTIVTETDGVAGAKITFRCTTLDEAGALLNSGEVTVSFMDAVTRRVCRPPDRFAQMFG